MLLLQHSAAVCMYTRAVHILLGTYVVVTKAGCCTTCTHHMSTGSHRLEQHTTTVAATTTACRVRIHKSKQQQQTVLEYVEQRQRIKQLFSIELQNNWVGINAWRVPEGVLHSLLILFCAEPLLSPQAGRILRSSCLPRVKHNIKAFFYILDVVEVNFSSS